MPIISSREKIRLNVKNINCDLFEFKSLYKNKNAIENCEKAIELYKSPLFYDEYYSWITLFEGYYDMRYLEFLERVIHHYTQVKNYKKVAYYTEKLKN